MRETNGVICYVGNTGGGGGRYCHEELGPGEERERKAGVVGDSSEEMEEGNFFQVLFSSLLEIAAVASRTAYLCYNSAQSIVFEDHRPYV